MKLSYKMKDLYNGDHKYSNTLSELRTGAQLYNLECEGDWLPEYRVLNLDSGKYKLMTTPEIKSAKLPL